MRILKRNINEKDYDFAFSILNKLRNGDRVFGKPAEGLKITFEEIQKEEEKPLDPLEFELQDREHAEKVAKLKKGIKGEKDLAAYIEKIVKHDQKLSDIVFAASLGEKKGKYFSDTDFLALYGNHLLAIDAKAVNTNPDKVVYVEGDCIMCEGKKEPLVEVSSCASYWRKRLPGASTVDGCVCIINSTGATIDKDDEYYASDIKPVHIADLVSFLHEWIKGKEPVLDLNILIEVLKEQIKDTRGMSLDLTDAKRIFGV